jgi:hypothetical protein
MQATLYELDGVPGPQDDTWVDAVLAALAPPAGAIVGRPLGLGPGLVVAFGPTAPDGFTASPVSARPGTAYQVAVHRTGRSTGPARYLQLTTFAGHDPEWCAAFDRAGEERMWPAVRDLPGLVAVLGLATSDGGRAALTLTESVEALDSGAARILSTDLLPWEKPEHLTGPDGMAVLRLLHADVPAAAPTA